MNNIPTSHINGDSYDPIARLRPSGPPPSQGESPEQPFQPLVEEERMVHHGPSPNTMTSPKELRYCRRCGAPIHRKSTRCPKCGKSNKSHLGTCFLLSSLSGLFLGCAATACASHYGVLLHFPAISSFLEPQSGRGNLHTTTRTDAKESANLTPCLLYTSPSPRDISGSRMPSSA